MKILKLSVVSADEPEPIRKSDQQSLLDGFQSIAKRRGMSLHEYLAANPTEYAKLKKASTVNVGAQLAPTQR